MQNYKKPLFTVYAGLYNSETVIYRLFESISSQSCRDFELIIIDDCSKDATVEITENYLKTITDVDVNFIKHKKNTGIAIVKKEVLALAKGELLVKWDHDDLQMPNQLQIYKEKYLKYKNQNIASVWALCKDNSGNILGNKYPEGETLGNYFSMYSKYILSTPKNPKERHSCVSVEANKKIYSYLYEKNILEEEVESNTTDFWCALALMGYNTLYINEPVRQYFIENDRPRLSNRDKTKLADRTFIDRYTWINHYKQKLPISDILWRVRLFASVNQYGILAGLSFKNIISKIDNYFDKIITSLFYIPIYLYIKKGKFR